MASNDSLLIANVPAECFTDMLPDGPWGIIKEALYPNLEMG